MRSSSFLILWLKSLNYWFFAHVLRTWQDSTIFTAACTGDVGAVCKVVTLTNLEENMTGKRSREFMKG